MPKQDLVYGKLLNLFDLALDMQQNAEGVSLSDIMTKYHCTRRTAERMRDALARCFVNMEEVPTGSRVKRWKITSCSRLNGLIGISADELAALDFAVCALMQSGINDQAAVLRHLSNKIKNLIPPKDKLHLDVDAEELIKRECLVWHPGPKIKIEQKILMALRNAILQCRKVKITYDKRGEISDRVLMPYGFIYGERNHYLIAKNAAGSVRNFVLTAIENVEILPDCFEFDDNFDVRRYTEESFGAFHGDEIETEWLFSKAVAQEAKRFVFHPSQTVSENADGTLSVRFKSSGILEMAWHLKTWGNAVKVIKPADFWRRANEAQARCDGEAFLP